jgi:hypothetical protein
MNIDKFEEAYIRSNVQMGYIIENRESIDTAKTIARPFVRAATSKPVRSAVKSVGRGAEATVKSVGRVVGSGADAATKQIGDKIKSTARKVYDRVKGKAPIVGKVGSALAPTVKAAGSQIGKESDKFDRFADKKLRTAYDKTKSRVIQGVRTVADRARKTVGLD